MSSQPRSQSPRFQSPFANFSESRSFALRGWQNRSSSVRSESPLDFQYGSGSRLESSSMTRTPCASQTFVDSSLQTQRSDQLTTTAESTAMAKSPIVAADQAMASPITTAAAATTSSATTTSTMGRSAVRSTIPAYLRPYISKEPILSPIGNRQGEEEPSSSSMSQSKTDNCSNNSNNAFHSLTTTLFSQSRELRFLLDRISSFDTVLNNVQRCFEDYEKRLAEGDNRSLESMASFLETKIAEKVSAVMEQESQKLMVTIQDRITDMQKLQEEQFQAKLDVFKEEMEGVVREMQDRAAETLKTQEEQFYKRIENFKQDMDSATGDIQRQIEQVQETQMGLMREELLVELKKAIATTSLQDELKELKSVISTQSQMLAVIMEQNRNRRSGQAQTLRGSINSSNDGGDSIGLIRRALPISGVEFPTKYSERGRIENTQNPSSQPQQQQQQEANITDLTTSAQNTMGLMDLLGNLSSDPMCELISSPCSSCTSSVNWEEQATNHFRAGTSHSPGTRHELEDTTNNGRGSTLVPTVAVKPPVNPKMRYIVPTPAPTAAVISQPARPNTGLGLIDSRCTIVRDVTDAASNNREGRFLIAASATSTTKSSARHKLPKLRRIAPKPAAAIVKPASHNMELGSTGNRSSFDARTRAEATTNKGELNNLAPASPTKPPAKSKKKRVATPAPTTKITKQVPHNIELDPTDDGSSSRAANITTEGNPLIDQLQHPKTVIKRTYKRKTQLQPPVIPQRQEVNATMISPTPTIDRYENVSSRSESSSESDMNVGDLETIENQPLMTRLKRRLCHLEDTHVDLTWLERHKRILKEQGR
ncbi:hypothetical protein BGZ80_002028 [Entomortierella chlamydospora]|uniref:Uncharacterized protein n=1 Tax=Entomortierella chlamydospora TaxID=101097 RepID=A0A9P6T351_9FUNG|nr:hypothetical protein BGZ80_002028 [Entomortierella chlamydospora]